MLEGYLSIPIEHFGGLVTAWPPEMLDASLLVEAVNLRFTSAEVTSREGLTLAFAMPAPAPVMGLLNYVRLDGSERPLVFDGSGHLYAESPAGSGHLALAAPGSTVVLPAAAWMNGAVAFNRAYLAFGNGATGVAAPASFDGANLDPVTIAAPTGVSSAADSATAGNVAAGVRYAVVLYMTREGSLTAPQAPLSWTAGGGKQVTVSGLPIGPAQVAARVVAFTVAGGSIAGPYFYIGEPQTVNGIAETATVVGDNVTTSATFNFDDAFLASSNDVSDQFRAIVLPNMSGVVFSETTQRLMWWGDPAQPSVVQCSEPSDGGNYFGDTGFFQVAENNGQRVNAVFEFRGQIYVAKDDSLHLVTPNNGDPATWDIQQISPLTGVCGARAVAVGDGWAVLVHRTGVYQFDGGIPTLISSELLGPGPDRPGIWERINWNCQHLIWTDIDNEAQCVRIGVPLDGATACSHILKVSYLDGWDSSIRFSPFTARYHYFPGRRWSLDTIAASQGVRVQRPLTLSGIGGDRRLSASQLLLGSAGSDGRVLFADPSSNLDDGQPIAWSVRTGSVSAAETVKQQRQGMEMLGVVQMRASGSGTVRIESIADGMGPVAFQSWELGAQLNGDHSGLALAQGEAVGLRLSNPDGPAAIHLMSLYLFVRPTWLLRPGQ
jgi:hypothetical protein